MSYNGSKVLLLSAMVLVIFALPSVTSIDPSMYPGLLIGQECHDAPVCTQFKDGYVDYGRLENENTGLIAFFTDTYGYDEWVAGNNINIAEGEIFYGGYYWLIAASICADPDGCPTHCGVFSPGDIDALYAAKGSDMYSDFDDIACVDIPLPVVNEFKNMIHFCSQPNPDPDPDIPDPVTPPASQINYINNLPSWTEIDFLKFRNFDDWVPPSDDFEDMLPSGNYWISENGLIPLAAQTGITPMSFIYEGLIEQEYTDPCEDVFVYLYYEMIEQGLVDSEGNIIEEVGAICYVSWGASNPLPNSFLSVGYVLSTGEPIFALYMDMDAFWEWTESPDYEHEDYCPMTLDIPFTVGDKSIDDLPVVADSLVPPLPDVPGFEIVSFIGAIALVCMVSQYRRRRI